MAVNIRKVKDLHGLVEYFAAKLGWNIDFDDFEDIEDITYDFDASDIGLKEEAFAKISALQQLPPLVDGQRWGIFSVEFDSKRFEVTALRKILSGLIPKRRNAANHAVWDQQDLLFLCFWGEGNERTIGVAHFADQEAGLPQIRMIYCAPAVEDFTQIMRFEERLSRLQWPDDTSDKERWREEWSGAFRYAYRQTITDSSTLTHQLAVEAQDIRDRIMEALDVEAPNGYVHTLYDKFKNTLIHDMTEQQFADMYAQTVDRPAYKKGCICINPLGDRIINVPEHIWNMYFGGYQPLQKWLKDRRGKVLTQADVHHLQYIVFALTETYEIMREIDVTINL